MDEQQQKKNSCSANHSLNSWPAKQSKLRTLELVTENQTKIIILPPLCGSVERALGFWPAKQPSAGRQQTTLLLCIRTLHYPVEVKM